MPSSCARRASSTLELMPSFAYAFARCVSTVRSETKSRFAIAAAVSPRDASRATSRSRWLSASVSRVARRLGRCFRPERKISTGVRIDSTSPSHARWSSPGNSTYVAPGMRSAMYLAWPTSIHRSPGAMEDQRRNADLGKQVTQIHLRVHADHGLRHGRARRHTQVPRPPLPVAFVVERARMSFVPPFAGGPRPTHPSEEPFELGCPETPGVVGSNQAASPRAVEDQRLRPFRVSVGEEEAERPSFRDSEQGRPG